jgi:hypothetical protein
LHELGHPFGFDSFRNADGQLVVDGKETAFDQYIDPDKEDGGALKFFDPSKKYGPIGITFFGGPHLAPLTGDAFEGGDHGGSY